jgi:hypothetical protein
MRTLLVGLLVLLCSAHTFTQPGVPRNVEFALTRIEQALREGYPASIEDMIQSGITMRLGDSLYQSIPSMAAVNHLKEFFANKDSIDFRFGMPGEGTMTYSSAGKRESVLVDVWLRRDHGEIMVYALNMSNYPVATVFFNNHPDKSKQEK